MLVRSSVLVGFGATKVGRDGYGRLLDGHQLVERGGRVQIRSRQGLDLTTAFADIAAAAAAQLPAGTLVDGELVVWNGDRLDFSQLQRRISGPARAAALARTLPASYVMFDVLQQDGQSLTDQPQRVRRRLLESLLPGLASPLQIVPSTRDRDVAARWFTDHAAADVGIEGLVLKNPAGRYPPGRRGWLKLRSRSSMEAVVGAVTGTLASPERLILGLPGTDNVLRVAGSTVPLSPAQRLEVGAHLQSFTGKHPWPPDVAAGGTGWTPGRYQPVTRVQPTLIVEIDADSSVTKGRFRHVTRLIRVRPDLQPGGLLSGLTKQVLETALNAEMSEHLGHEHGATPDTKGNVRKGYSAKTVRTEIGDVRIQVPRDRAGSFEPVMVPKHARHLSGFDEAVISLYAKGMTTGDIVNHLADVYGTSVSKDLVSRVTDAVLEQMQTRSSRPWTPSIRSC